MVKQTKTFKKGNVTKKALSAILAASMVMTSSSFVMAAPVEVEDVAVEAAAETEEVAVGAEDVENVESVDETVDAEEQVGTSYKSVVVQVLGSYTYNGSAIVPKLKVTGLENGLGNEWKDVPVDSYEIKILGDNVNAGEVGFQIKFVGNYGSEGTIDYVKQGMPANNNNNKTQDKGTFTIAKQVLTAADTTVTYTTSATGYKYNGKVQVPEAAAVKVNYQDGTEVKSFNLASDDYKVVGDSSNDDLKNAHVQNIKLILTAKGQKNLEIKSGETIGAKSYEITAGDFNDSTIEATTKILPVNTKKAYSAEDVKKYLTVKNSETKEVLNDYEVELYDRHQGTDPVSSIQAPGTYEVVVKPATNDKNYQHRTTDMIKVSVKIGVATLEDAVDMIKTSQITVGGAAGSYLPTPVKEDTDGFYVEYNGNELGITFINGGDWSNNTGLVMDTDFKYTNFVKGTNAGDVISVTLKGLGAYEGQTATLKIQVRPRLIESNNVMKEGETGKSFKYAATIEKSVHFGKYSDNATFTFAHWFGDSFHTLVEGKDYTYTTNSDGNVVVTGMGNYTTNNPATKGTTITLVSTKSTISKQNIADPSIKASVTGTYSYNNGVAVTPNISEIKLVETNGTETYDFGDLSKDFVVKQYGDKDMGDKNPENKNAGVGYITLEAKNNSTKYTGTKTFTFEIAGTDIGSVYTVKPMKDLTKEQATAMNKFQEPEVVYTNGGNLAETANYGVRYLRNGKVTTDFTTPGTITVEVYGKGGYTGKVTTSYKVVGTDISTVAYIEDIAEQKYTGTAIEPAVTVYNTKNGVAAKNILHAGVDYTLSYKNNVEVGTASVVITGIGAYSGTYVKTFKIVGQMEQDMQLLAAQVRDIQNRTLNSKTTVVKFETGKTPKTAVTYASSDENVVKVDETGKITYTGLGEATITVKATATEKYKAAEATMTVKVGLAKPSFTPFSKNNAFTLTSSTVKGAEKFEVEYATKKDFSNSKTKTFATTSAGKVRQVKVSAADKKTYYVRVRAISGTTKSAWSTTKTVATK